jgi:hypothetical protein
MRHALRFYRALIITGLYVQDVKDTSPEGLNITTFTPALKHYIATYPILSTAIHREQTEAPQYVRPGTLDLRNHIEICDPYTAGTNTAVDEAELLQKVTVKTYDQMF